MPSPAPVPGRLARRGIPTLQVYDKITRMFASRQGRQRCPLRGARNRREEVSGVFPGIEASASRPIVGKGMELAGGLPGQLAKLPCGDDGTPPTRDFDEAGVFQGGEGAMDRAGRHVVAPG